MKLNDFIILMMVCLFWGGNFVVTSWALAKNPVPPFMLGTVRALIVIIILSPFLFKPLPQHFKRLLIICFLVGPCHLGFLYMGLTTSSASASAIVSQFLIPISTILSIIFLKERIGLIRSLAIAGSFIGVIIMIYDPKTFTVERGLILLLFAYVSVAIASILMKRVGEIKWQQYVVWMGVVILSVMLPATLLFEGGQAQVWQNSKSSLLIAAAYASIFVSCIAHGQYFEIIKKYDVSIVVPLTLMTPVFAIIMGMLFLGDEMHMRYWIGAVIILPCVYIIARRTHGEKRNEKAS